jgi:hypothetical protein
MVTSRIGDFLVALQEPFAPGVKVPPELGMALMKSAEVNALVQELKDARDLHAKVAAVASEYRRESRLISSGAVGMMLEDWLNGA